MRERSALELATLKARCPVVIDRPLVTRAQHAVLAAAAVAWPLAIVRMALEWPWPARVPAAVALLGGFVLLLVLARHTRRSGSFRLAADERSVYFRETPGGDVRAFEWRLCRHLGTVAALGEQAVRFEFELDGDDPWKTLAHAQVFLRDRSVEIVAMDLSDAPTLLARLEALRAVATQESLDETDGAGRAAA